jgi:hypothetical protein
MSISERRAEKMRKFVAPHLGEGEQVTAVMPTGQTGPSPWFALLTYLIFFWIRMYAIVVTDRRVVFVRCSIWTCGPRRVEDTPPRGDVSVLEWTPGALWGKLVLDRKGQALKLNVHRAFRAGADAVVAALGAGTASA